MLANGRALRLNPTQHFLDNPASFIARNFSSTEPFTPIVEYMMALRRFRFAAAGAAAVKAAAAALPIIIFKNDRRFIM